MCIILFQSGHYFYLIFNFLTLQAFYHMGKCIFAACYGTDGSSCVRDVLVRQAKERKRSAIIQILMGAKGVQGHKAGRPLSSSRSVGP
jgi:hypothetical protein